MIYTGITPEWLAAIETNAASALGMAIDGDEGAATKDGITISWVYDPTAQTLTVGDTKKPWFVLESAVEEKLTALVNSSKPPE